MKNHRFNLLFGTLLLLLGAVGCGKTPEPLHPVSGVVTVKGKPLDGGTVQFEMKQKGDQSGQVLVSLGHLPVSTAFG